ARGDGAPQDLHGQDRPDGARGDGGAGLMPDLSPTLDDTPWITKEQLAFREDVLGFARKELADSGTIERDRTGEFWREGWDASGRFGIQGLPVPQEEGGQGCDPLTTAVALEALGYGCDDG